MKVDHDRAVGSLVGLAIGDALGTTLEFSPRDSKPPLTQIVGGGPFGLKPGQWTDDTSMALCLAESLIACDGVVDPPDLMTRFSRWYREGENSVTGRCFDIGIATRGALERFERTGETAASLPVDPQGAGNGTLMRLAPVAILAAPDLAHAADLAEAQSRTTHTAELAHAACRLFATMLVEAMSGRAKDEVLRPRAVEGELRDVAAGAWRKKRRHEIVSSGYVLATLEASLWCVGTTDSFPDAVLLAANLGDDADTVAAVTGQLAGALYGVTGIPERWLGQLAWRERIEQLGRKLLEHRPDPGVIRAVRATPQDAAGRALSRASSPSTIPSGDASSQPQLTTLTLTKLGFVDVARWRDNEGKGLAYDLHSPDSEVDRLRLQINNALYAFVRGQQVLYIGKTARSVRKRFVGYCRPGARQVTNLRCHKNIKLALARDEELRILVFNPLAQLRYDAFEINLAAGLEDALIAEFVPPWNGREKDRPVSEEIEREKTEEAAVDMAPDSEPETMTSDPTVAPLVTFKIKLGQAYYHQGLINPGAVVSRHLGQSGEPIEIAFDDGAEPVISSINRTAQNGHVRVVGRNRFIAAWFQRHFRMGDVVEADVLGPNRIRLRSGLTENLGPRSEDADEAPIATSAGAERDMPDPANQEVATTSIPPLRIAEIVPATGGCIGITIAPGKKQVDALSGRHNRDLGVDLDAIAAWGATEVVTLVEASELKALQIEQLGDEVRRRGMAWHHLPIPDWTAPNAAFDLDWPGHSARLRDLLTNGQKVLIHCKGGLGRAGTIAARVLVELGSSPADAVATVRAVRPGAIETEAQLRWVGRDWISSADHAIKD